MINAFYRQNFEVPTISTKIINVNIKALFLRLLLKLY